MLKIAALLFALLVIGSSAFDLNDLDNLNKKDLMEIGKTLFCACDEDESGDLDYQEVSGGACAAVIDHVFDHEVSEEEFNMVDANGDGVLDPEELLDFAEANAHHLGRASQRMFDTEHVDTALRLVGCACDKNGDGALKWWEIKRPICRWVQKTVSGGKVISKKTFKKMDSNGDKKIDEAEGLAALEAFLEEHQG